MRTGGIEWGNKRGRMEHASMGRRGGGAVGLAGSWDVQGD